MSTQDNKEEKKDTVRTDIEQRDGNTEDLTNGETSSVGHLDRSSFTNTPKRKNTSLGSSHEPGTTPGREI